MGKPLRCEDVSQADVTRKFRALFEKSKTRVAAPEAAAMTFAELVEDLDEEAESGLRMMEVLLREHIRRRRERRQARISATHPMRSDRLGNPRTRFMRTSTEIFESGGSPVRSNNTRTGSNNNSSNVSEVHILAEPTMMPQDAAMWLDDCPTVLDLPLLTLFRVE